MRALRVPSEANLAALPNPDGNGTGSPPMMLAASWFVCRWCGDRLNVRRTVPARSLMGFVAFLVLMSAEIGLGAVLGRSLLDQLAAYKSRSGAIGLAAQVIFAIFPVLQVWPRFGNPSDRQNTAPL